MTKEQLEYAIGHMMSASVFSKAALSFLVDKGLASPQEVAEMLDVSLLAFEQIEGRPGITNKVIFQLARADIEEFSSKLPDLASEGAARRADTSPVESPVAASAIAKAAMRLMVEHGMAPIGAARNALGEAARKCEQPEARAEIAALSDDLWGCADGADERLARRLRHLHRMGVA